MPRLSRLLIAGLLTTFFSTTANGNDGPRRFTFAKQQIQSFELEAYTEWVADTVPTVRQVGCGGDNTDVNFFIDEAGGIEILSTQFLTDPDALGRRDHGTSLGDQLWLYVDGQRFEFRHIGKASSRFLNFSYPPAEGGEIILVWTGSRAIRQSDSEPFRPLTSIYEQMVNAKKLAWRMKKPDPTRTDRPRDFDPTRRYRIDNAGLREAVEWCRRQVTSPAARTLPEGDLKDLMAK